LLGTNNLTNIVLLLKKKNESKTTVIPQLPDYALLFLSAKQSTLTACSAASSLNKGHSSSHIKHH